MCAEYLFDDRALALSLLQQVLNTQMVGRIMKLNYPVHREGHTKSIEND